MRDWDDLSELEQLATIYSDAHKDAYGFRPRGGGIHNPTTVEEYRAAIEDCGRTIEEEEKRERAYEAKALAAFEAEIATLVADHGIARETALRWWFEAEGFEPRDHIGWARQDAEHVLWKRGIAIREWPAIVDGFLPLPSAA